MYWDLKWISVKKKYGEVARSAGNFPRVCRLIENMGFRRVVIGVLKGTTTLTQPPREPDTINQKSDGLIIRHRFLFPTDKTKLCWKIDTVDVCSLFILLGCLAAWLWNFVHGNWMTPSPRWTDDLPHTESKRFQRSIPYEHSLDKKLMAVSFGPSFDSAHGERFQAPAAEIWLLRSVRRCNSSRMQEMR